MNATRTLPASPKFVLTLYVAMNDEATQKQIQNLRNALGECFQADPWKLSIVEVLDEPETAVANDIFTTPTLVRESPGPVLKVLDGLDSVQNVLKVLTHIRPH